MGQIFFKVLGGMARFYILRLTAVIYFILLIQYASNVVTVAANNNMETAETAETIWKSMDNPSSSSSWFETWNGLGACSDGENLIRGLEYNMTCIRQLCLYSLMTHDRISLKNLLRPEGSLISQENEQCYMPSRGQVKSELDVEVSFIFTLHNGDRMAARAILEAFRTAHEIERIEFVIVLDGCTEKMSRVKYLVRQLRTHFNTDIHTMVNRVSQGYGASNVQALKAATGKYAVTLNSDLLVLPSWITLLKRTFLSFPGPVGLVGPLQISPLGTVMEHGGLIYEGGNPANGFRFEQPNHLPMYSARLVDYNSASCLFFDRVQFLNFGLFDPDFHPAYYEDTDAAMTYLQNGFESVVQPLAVVVHVEGGSIPSMQKEELLAKNHDKFYHKHQNLLGGYCPAQRPCELRISGGDAHGVSALHRQYNRILWIDSIAPEPDKDSGSMRTLEMLRILQLQGYHISYSVTNKGRHLKYALNLLADGINYMHTWKLKKMLELRRINGKMQCPWKFIVVARLDVYQQMKNTLKQLCKTEPVIFDTVDLHYMREERKLAHEIKLQEISEADQVVQTTMLAAMKKQELSFMSQSDAVLVTSTVEAELLQHEVPDAKVYVVSNIYDAPVKLPVTDPKKRHGALFVGSLCHPPNIDAVQFLVRDVLALNTVAFAGSGVGRGGDEVSEALRVLGLPENFKMHIVLSKENECRKGVESTIFEALEHPLVEIHMDITNEELEALHEEVRMVIAPVRYGAGVKGKITHALVYGVPVLTTTIGAEGLHLTNGSNVIIADTGLQLREGIQLLSMNDAIWFKYRNRGFKVAKEFFSREVANATLSNVLQQLDIIQDAMPWTCPYRGKSICAAAIIPADPQLTYATNFVPKPRPAKIPKKQPKPVRKQRPNTLKSQVRNRQKVPKNNIGEVNIGEVLRAER